MATAPWQECGEELAEREQRKAEVCQRESRSGTGAEGARRDTMLGGGGALAAVHSGKGQAATA